MRHHLHLASRVATIVAWALASFDILPWGPTLPDHALLYVIAVACVGSYAWIARTHARPADEVYLAGKAIGRREVELEQECDRVVRLSERRLTIVGE